jgi:isopenicillin N synthase-like dioxygenase
MEVLADALLRIFAIALELPEFWFRDKIDRHSSALRALNYPEQTRAPIPGQLRASAHTDYGSLTILKSGGPGLQVQDKNGEWIDISPSFESFVVNLGDLMANWTNDMWASTPHRVVVSSLSGERRQSMAFFHNPNSDAVIACIPTCCRHQRPKYPPITAGEHLMRKHVAAMKPY